MRDKDLYARILNIKAPWRVADVKLNLQQGEVVVHVEHDGEALNCPECGQPARRYDTQRRWRHLDTCQYRTILAAEMPGCSVSGGTAAVAQQMALSWDEVDGIMQRGLERPRGAGAAADRRGRRCRNAMST